MNREKFEQIHLNHLNPKQRQVLALVLTGQNNQQIARKIEVNEPSGISYHVRRIAQKFGIGGDYRDCLIELFIQHRPELVSECLQSKYGLINLENHYQVGGTLSANCHSYVERECDRTLFATLIRGNYCLVLNPRQTGKSSLKIRTMAKLKQKHIKCVSIDITNLGGNERQESRTKGFVAELFSQLSMTLDVNNWWQNNQHFTLMQRLNKSLALVLENTPGKIIIFVDEIDSIPNADDFFALIRACYNQRTENFNFNRLTFCLLGTVSPHELMRNKQRTPFNIGINLDLPGFTFDLAKKGLLSGLATAVNNPEAILKEIICWTNGQPFLTQKLCQLAANYSDHDLPTLQKIIDRHIVDDWRQQDSPQHLQTIYDRLLTSPLKEAILDRYRQILGSQDNQTRIALKDDNVDMQLIMSGLIINKSGYLQVHNPIYARIFNLQWLNSLD